MAVLACREKHADSITSATRRLSRVVLALALGAAPAARSLTADSGQFSSGVNLVEVYAAVVDHDGRPVTGLQRDDFTVLEDGRPQTLSAFAEGDFPLSVAVAVDRSFSMAGRELTNARDAARTFLSALRPTDQAMIVAVGSEIETVASLSSDRQAQQRAVASLEPWGTTGLHDAIIASIDAIQTAKGRRALVLLSDGNDRYSNASQSDALSRARRADVMIYPIALGKTRPALFAELATLTGGRSFQPRDAKQLTDTMQTIANELGHQYLLGYTPSRAIVSGDEQWRSITVRVRRPDLTVRARDGYLAK
jgi:Ca-activated chloride channel family protein